MARKKTSGSAEEKSSAWYFYNCAHGSSNTPCPKGCFSTGPGLPDPEPMPDNWMESYIPPGFKDCPDCVRKPGGQGRVDAETACKRCKGRGYVPEDESESEYFGTRDSASLRQGGGQ